jgi:hypothetical protein
MEFNNIPRDILLIIIRFQIKSGDYNPAIFSKSYHSAYMEYMRKETHWLNS